jgi:hypothetical protein
VSAEFHRAEQMLKRFAFTSPPDELAQRRQFGFRQVAFEFEIKLDPFPSQHVGKQMFRIQTRTVDPAFFEIRSRRLQHVEHSHMDLRNIVCSVS